MRVGDLTGSDTISCPQRDSRGLLLELSWGGKEPFKLEGGTIRFNRLFHLLNRAIGASLMASALHIFLPGEIRRSIVLADGKASEGFSRNAHQGSSL